MYKIPIITLFAILLLPILSETADSQAVSHQQIFPIPLNMYVTTVESEVNPSFSIYESNEIEEFENWARDNGITIVGVNIDQHHLYNYGYDPKTDHVNWKEIPRVLVAADALYKVPKNVIKVMDGKTIYFSTEHGRSYTIFGKPMPADSTFLKGVDRGLFLEQNINQKNVLHELGHIVDYHGIQGRFYDKQHIFDHLIEDRISIFNVPQKYQPNTGALSAGYISVYSSKSDKENFAENFAYYIVRPDVFREKIQTDTLLAEKYEFMRDKIFSGFEY
ncbi:MAG: hypothetical protein QQN45_07725 [Nitrosopumilus sp.]